MARPKKLSVIPAAGYLLIKQEEAERTTASGIVLPDTVDGEKPQQGQVLAIGDDMVTDKGATIKAPCKIGDTVIYKKWGTNEYKYEEVEYLFVKFDDVMGIISK
jgi:chaperonin GroES